MTKKVLEVAARTFWVATAAALLFIGVLPFCDKLGVDHILVGILFLITVVLGRHTLALQVPNAESRPIRYCIALITSVPAFGKSLVEQGSHLIVTHLEFDSKGQQLGRFQTC